MSAVATRRASLTPSSPASRRGSWVDVPAASAPPSRRGSRVDLSINTSLASASSSASAAAPTTAEPVPGPSQAKLAIGQLLTNFSQVSEPQRRMSSPKGSRSPVLSDPHGIKRKYDADTDPSSTAFKASAASEIQLPTDPLRRASIINLATAAAAAVLQSQVGQRRMSIHPEQEQKRQRVEQLGLLIEQARKASIGSLSHDIARHVESASQNAAIASALADHLGITPQSSAASTPSAGTPVPASPTKAPATSLAVPATPTTPKSPLASEPFTAAFQPSVELTAQDAPPTSDKTAVSNGKIFSSPKAKQALMPPSPSAKPFITVNSTEAAERSQLHTQHEREWQSTVASDGFLDEAKQAAHTYSRFYRFEKEWAQKALELERRRSSVRIDPLFNPNPTMSPLAAESAREGSSEDKARGAASPKQHSAPESRAMSRGTSPFAEFSTGVSSSRTAHSVPSGSFSSHRGSSSSLANVLSNFAELIEHRQRSCSGLEALAKQAKELPVKRLSQPNPQLRTTFGEFSWVRKQSTGPSPGGIPASARNTHASRTILETDADSDTPSLTADKDKDKDKEDTLAAPLGRPSPARPALPHGRSDTKKIKQEPPGLADVDSDAPVTPRSTMSIASML